DFGDAALLRVAHFFDELAIEERLPVVVDANMRDAERGAFVDDLLVEIHRHDTLAAVHLVAWTEHALCVAEIGALDLNDVRQTPGPVAARGEEHAPDRLRVCDERLFGDGTGAALQAHFLLRSFAEAISGGVTRLCSMTRRRISFRPIVGAYPM